VAPELLIARLLLAAIFAVAAVGKLGDQTGTRASLSDFGLSARFAAPGAVALPLLELVVAALLVPSASARVGAVGCLALLVVFTVVIARAMARGEEPECHCFGAIHSAPAGWSALLRNLALAGVAAVVAFAGPGESVGAALGDVDAAVLAGVLALVVVLLGQAVFSWQLMRQNGRLLERVRALEESSGSSRPAPGLPVGDHAPSFALVDLDGVTRTLADLLAPGLPVAIAFSEPDCQACSSLVAQLARLRATRAGELEVALITRGSTAENRTKLGAGALPTVLLQHEREVATQFGVASVPSAMVVAPDGYVASRLAIGQLAIEELLSSHGAPVAVSALRTVGAGR
jgi:uncharacterized membrane protein YphA (DoxX/SURF4 family)/peroxiredoxin